jgi:gliding motility-associated-like protein
VGYSAGAADLARLYFKLYVKTINDAVCKPAYDTIKVLMSAIPTPKFVGVPLDGCVPYRVDFADSSTIDFGHINQWSWEFGDGSTSTAQHPNHEYTREGSYTVILKVTSDAGCVRQATKVNYVNVHVVPKPIFIPKPGLVLISSPSITFQNQTKYETTNMQWLWDFGDGKGTSTVREPVYKYADTGHYKVWMRATNEWGCTDTTTRNVVVLPDVIAYIPTAFSPDNLGPDTNNVFRVYVDGVSTFEIQIYSRWGQLLYESTDYEHHGWDGSYLNTTDKVPVGVYIYVMKLTGMNGIDYKYSGNVTLIR